MRIIEGEVLSSASDLNDFLACSHRTALHRDQVVRGEAPPECDSTLEVIAKKGVEHEHAVRDGYAAAGIAVTRIPDREGSPAALAAAVALTREAMKRGDAVIYQPAFLREGWTGRADFLIRVPGASRLGDYCYEIADAKLAVRERPSFLVQLCTYARFVEEIQGVLPPRVVAVLGSGETRAFDPANYIAYVDAARTRYFSQYLHLDAAAIPDRIGACGECAYDDRCGEARRSVDHLSFVAGIRASQIARLSAAGVTTLSALSLADPDVAVRGIGAQTYATLVRQARLQAMQRATGEHVYELLRPAPATGFALLPAPDAGDIYFDIEGDPLFEPGAGLEYLFGVFTRDEGYRAFWGETRAEEKTAFEEFIDWVGERRKRFPASHVYHYAAYEKSALQRLAMRHATREDEVDNLLRGEVLVDLYTAFRGAAAQSQASYSIKKLEPFYAFKRTADVRKGDDSIVAFERYLADRDPQTRDDIITYNDEDCRSTRLLHEWMMRLRREAEAQFGPIPFRAQIDIVLSEKKLAQIAANSALEAALVERADACGDASSARRLRLLASLLSYHQREEKPAWWALFNRYQQASDGDDFLDDEEALGELVFRDDIPPIPPKKSNARPIFTYTYPPQNHKIKPGAARDPFAGKDGADLTIDAIDREQRLVTIRRNADDPHPRALIPGGPIPTVAQQNALQRLAHAALAGTAEVEYPAAVALLDRALPRIDGLAPGDRIQPPERDGAIAASDVSNLVLRLRDSALVVQGPPGTGKTYTGARVIAALLEANRRVAVTATGHEAMNNLLDATERAVVASGRRFRGVKKADEHHRYRSPFDAPCVETVNANRAFAEFELVAGTSWLMARQDLEPLHVLIVDEAGQVALADAVASAMCARAIVLLGDPKQLAQVSLGTHPQGAGVSVLEHLIGAGTVTEERGVFLERSYRMHPAICAFISETMYEGRLNAAPGCAQQRIDGPEISGAGLRYVPVEHVGNSQSSQEEADAVGDIIAGLVGGTFTAADGSVRPMRLADVLVVAPYNAQVNLLRERLFARFGDHARVGTVDKFQGQEAPAVIYSMAASSAEDAPRGADFLLEENRFNVAVSRGRALAFLVCSPRLLATPCTSVELLRAAAAFCAFEAAAVERAAVA